MKIWPLCDKVVFITKQDYDYAVALFKALKKDLIIKEKFTYIYDGADNGLQNLYLKNNQKIQSLVFMASDQIPNVLSFNWFIGLWKKIKSNIKYNLHVYGKICDAFTHRRKELEKYGIILKGFVSNKNKLNEILSKYILFVSPTVVGSGYRTKILDVGSIGLPTLCTEFDYKPFEGILEKNKHILTFQNTEDFLNQLKKIESNEVNLDLISKNIYNLIEKNLTWNNTADQFIKIYEELLLQK